MTCWKTTQSQVTWDQDGRQHKHKSLETRMEDHTKSSHLGPGRKTTKTQVTWDQDRRPHKTQVTWDQDGRPHKHKSLETRMEDHTISSHLGVGTRMEDHTNTRVLIATRSRNTDSSLFCMSFTHMRSRFFLQALICNTRLVLSAPRLIVRCLYPATNAAPILFQTTGSESFWHRHQVERT